MTNNFAEALKAPDFEMAKRSSAIMNCEREKKQLAVHILKIEKEQKLLCEHIQKQEMKIESLKARITELTNGAE